ncbi:MAG TPA: hypothetical protein VIE43_07160 [Thermoanaerobaculia bacterium]|jgi:hypothetical protein|nr:hypothetical protein [Thermoanaerobaculia bacterium]
MTPEDLDRILSSEERIVPSSGFAAAVLERTREATPPSVPFPWRRYLLGLLVLLAISGLWGWLGVRPRVAEAVGGAFDAVLAAVADPRLGVPLAEAMASLVGAWLVVRLTLGFTGARR